ncbi:hypothetical protein S40288_10959 [Stachybotrys chartarum IBT 40288]|nr:hypothetical protein S40288_10959 [Stachybotrys chartarum IBT 40288]
MFLETVTGLVVAWVVSAFIESFNQAKTDLPRVGASPVSFNLQSPSTNHVVQTLMGDTVVLAPKFLAELNMLRESKLSSTASLVDSVMGQYTGVDLLLRGPFDFGYLQGLVDEKSL